MSGDKLSGDELSLCLGNVMADASFSNKRSLKRESDKKSTLASTVITESDMTIGLTHCYQLKYTLKY